MRSIDKVGRFLFRESGELQYNGTVPHMYETLLCMHIF